ncbi:MAG: RDD family protein [Nanoarchaeota archaeon]
MKKINLPKDEFISPALIWKRIVAFLIDMLIIVLVVFIPFRKFIGGMIPQNGSFIDTYKLLAGTEQTGQIAAIYFGMSLLTFLYFYKLENRMGQTIGKKIMNLYVVSDLNPQKRWQMALRNAAFIPIFPFDVLVIADPLVMLFTKSNQRLTEIIGKTRVVEKQSYTVI